MNTEKLIKLEVIATFDDFPQDIFKNNGKYFFN